MNINSNYYDETGVSGMNFWGQDYYFRKNILGDIVAIYDMNGNWVGGYTYDAWGNTTILEGSDCILLWNPFRWRGYYQDQETGFYYLQSRYYDPATGRFINADEPTMLLTESAMAMGANLFMYCYNNPVMFTDPSGYGITLGVAILIGFIVGAVVGAASSTISQVIEYGWSDINGWQVLLDGIIGGISGALSMTGFGIVGQMIGGVVLGLASYVVDGVIRGKDPTFLGIISSMALGGLFGAMGGDGLFHNAKGRMVKGTASKLVSATMRSALTTGGISIAFTSINRVMNLITDGGWSNLTGLNIENCISRYYFV